jgi:hypothetical protein
MNCSTDSMVYIVIMYYWLEKCVNDGIVIGYDYNPIIYTFFEPIIHYYNLNHRISTADHNTF